MAIALALIVGFVAGLRAFTSLALVSWAARLGWLQLQGTWLGFLGYAFTVRLREYLRALDSRPAPFRRLATNRCWSGLGLASTTRGE